MVIPYFMIHMESLYLYWSVAAQECFEFVELDLTGAVLINLHNQLLDINSHLEILFYCINQLLSIDTTVSIWITSHSDEGLQ